MQDSQAAAVSPESGPRHLQQDLQSGAPDQFTTPLTRAIRERSEEEAPRDFAPSSCGERAAHHLYSTNQDV